MMYSSTPYSAPYQVCSIFPQKHQPLNCNCISFTVGKHGLEAGVQIFSEYETVFAILIILLTIWHFPTLGRMMVLSSPQDRHCLKGQFTKKEKGNFWVKYIFKMSIITNNIFPEVKWYAQLERLCVYNNSLAKHSVFFTFSGKVFQIKWLIVMMLT